MKEKPRNSQFAVDQRHRGLAQCGQRWQQRASENRIGDGGGARCGIGGRMEAPGAGMEWTAGQWAVEARGCPRDSGGCAGQHAEVGRCGDSGGSAALGEAPGTALSFEHG
jgi:hypothetical protein